MLWIGILIFLILMRACKILEPYNNPFWDFNNRGEKKKSGIIPKIVAYLSLLHWSHALRSYQQIKKHVGLNREKTPTITHITSYLFISRVAQTNLGK